MDAPTAPTTPTTSPPPNTPPSTPQPPKKDNRGGPRLGAGRPKLKKEEKRKPRSFKATQKEYEDIEKNARQHKMNISEFIRHRTLNP